MAYAGLPVVVPVALGVIAFVAWLMSTRFGLSVRAIHDDENVAHLFGVNLRTTQVAAMTIGGAIGGIGATLLRMYEKFSMHSAKINFSKE